jgi:Domain of unknown function (DUF4382)
MKRNVLFQIIAISLFFLAACGGGGDSAPSTGTVSVAVTDATTTEYDAIYVTIGQVAVQKSDGSSWEVISEPNKTYNLLELVNGVIEELGIKTLSTGHYTQMRLILIDDPDNSINILGQLHAYGNYFIAKNSSSQTELKVPSGFQTGIKIVKGFDINANQTTELILDFDAARSIVMAGNSGTWLLKPTIKVMETREYGIISGNAGQGGVLVSAQTYDASALLAGQVQIAASTVSEINGDYRLLVAPGFYTLVGYKDGFQLYCSDEKVESVAGEEANVDSFALVASSPNIGTLTGGTVSISGPEQYVTISVRQAVTVEGTQEQIEVKSLNLAEGGSFTTNLPFGTYTAVISLPDGAEAYEVPFTLGASYTIGAIVF